MPPTLVTPNTSWGSSSWYIIQDYNNRKYILAGSKDEFLSGQLRSATMDLNYNVNFPITNSVKILGLAGSTFSYADSFFTDSGIVLPSTTTFDVTKYNKLMSLPTPLGYVEVKWGLSDNNLDRTETSSPKINGDATVNINKLSGAVSGNSVFVFMNSALGKGGATDPMQIYRLYKKKNNADFNAEIKNESNYISQSTKSTDTLKKSCIGDQYRSPGCSISFLDNKTIIGKLRYTLYASDNTTILNYGYATLQDMQSSNHFKDYLGNNTNGVCVYEGFISLPYTDSYTFASSHDDGVLITLNGVDIINNSGYGNDTSSSYRMDAGTYTFKVKLTNTAGPGAINIQYKTIGNATLTDIPTSWFSTTYFVNMSDYLQNIFNIQNNYCSNNLNQSWCQNMSKLNTADSNNIYKKYCISNSTYLTDYPTCSSYYDETTDNDLTTTAKAYCTSNDKLFNTKCIPSTTTNPSYLNVPIWEGKKKYCDPTKFATDSNCQTLISNTDNISLFDRLLGDNCSADKLTTEPCKSAVTISSSATDFTKLPYYTFQGIKKCIMPDGKLDTSTQFCKDTANDVYSKKGAFLMEPVMNYCKGTTTTNGVTSNNITGDFCTTYINKHKCDVSGFKANNDEVYDSTESVEGFKACPSYDHYYSMIILILILVISIVLIKLNFKIDNIYEEYYDESN